MMVFNRTLSLTKENTMNQKSQQALTIVILSSIVAILGSILGSTMGNVTVSIVCSAVALILLGFGVYAWRTSARNAKDSGAK